jgi:hypothetical protein
MSTASIAPPSSAAKLSRTPSACASKRWAKQPGSSTDLDPQLDRVIMLYKGFTATVENHLQYEDAS